MFESFSNKEKESPFKSGVIENEFEPEYKVILQLKNNPEIIVRKENYDYYGEDKDNISLEEKIQYHAEAKKRLETLSSEYGIHIPPFDFVAGKNEHGNDCMYTITRKVHGDKLEQVLKNNRAMPEATELLLSLTRYVDDTMKAKKDLFWDIYSPKQYRFGKIEGETKDRAYLVDFEPWQIAFDHENERYGTKLQSVLADINGLLKVISFDNSDGRQMASIEKSVKKLRSATEGL